MIDTAPRSDAEASSGQGRLKARVVSAAAMIAVALTAAVLGGWGFTALIVAIGLLMVWEWGRMVRGTTWDLAMIIHGATHVVTCVLVTFAWPTAGLICLCLGALAMAICVSRNTLWISTVGVIVIGLAGATLIWLRNADDLGLLAVLFILGAVWITDTFAMVIGKAVGGPLLFPSVSPRKTWAGAIGGLLAAGLGGAFFVSMLTEGGWLHGLLIACVLSCAAQIGDLLESAVKRSYSVKNTSELIPGHGGVLDRMDGLIGATLVAAPLAVALSWSQPVRGLLLGE
ncbi:MAG: phosphatidate cytidylyltransferase [Pseudomonadota bacterium]